MRMVADIVHSIGELESMGRNAFITLGKNSVTETHPFTLPKRGTGPIWSAKSFAAFYSSFSFASLLFPQPTAEERADRFDQNA